MCDGKWNCFDFSNDKLFQLILGGDPLDENMLENVALLGLNLAHLMGNTTLFTRFEELLQNIVY